jgi:diadenosine tetraphosphate (Ap4A) HIT family hydrolase
MITEYVTVYETENFKVEAVPKPHVSREEGGHLRIKSKEKYFSSRMDFNSDEAKEVMRLSMMSGEALKRAMTNRGIPILRINYMEAGNWAVKTGKPFFFHIHVYGRCENAKVQVWPEAVQLPSRETGFYDSFIPLNLEDVRELKKQFSIIENEERYKLSNW